MNFNAQSPICQNEYAEINIEISNALHNYYTIIIEDSTQEAFIIDSFGNEFSVLDADPRRVKRLRLNLKKMRLRSDGFFACIIKFSNHISWI